MALEPIQGQRADIIGNVHAVLARIVDLVVARVPVPCRVALAEGAHRSGPETCLAQRAHPACGAEEILKAAGCPFDERLRGGAAMAHHASMEATAATPQRGARWKA